MEACRLLIRSVAVTLCIVTLSDALGQREVISPDSEHSQGHVVSKRQWGRTGNVAWGKRWGGNVAWGKRWGANNVAWGKRNGYDLDEDNDNLVDKRDWKHIRLRAWGKRSVDAVKSRLAQESQALNPDKKAWGRQVSWGKRGATNFPLYKGTIAEDDNDDVENDLKRAWHGSAVSWGKRQEQKDDKRAWGGNVSWGKRGDDKRAWGGNNVSWGKRWGTGNAVAWGKRAPLTEEQKRAWHGGNVAWGKKRAWSGNVSWGKRDDADADDKRAWVGKSISWGKRDAGEEEDKKRAWAGNVSWGKRQADQDNTVSDDAVASS